MHYVIVDIETTGGSPQASKITEIAMYKHDGTQFIDEFVTLVNPGMKIPDFIVRLTGISDAMVETAPHFYEIAKKIVEFSENCVFVAHNVGFDYNVIRHEFKSLGFDYRRTHLCTVRASRYILPGHDSYSLGKLTRALGIQLKGRHRAGGDAHATALLFQMLFAKSEKNLKTFLQEDLNPKILHPNLDLNELDEIPNKTGIYKFFDDANRLIYIGKSKHIRKRIDQHLRNTKTKKGIEMMSEISRIEFELTGSELIALLYECSLIKQHKPFYNKALRKNQFPYGIFSFQDSKNYLHLYIDKTAGKLETPFITFSSKAEANSYMAQICEKMKLCEKLCGLYKSQSSCFGYEIKKCYGACVQEEPAAIYNKRVEEVIRQHEFSEQNFYLIENGRMRNEKCLILVENGTYRGYGFVPYYVMKHPRSSWKKHIDFYEEDRDIRTILHLYLRKNPDLNIVSLDRKS